MSEKIKGYVFGISSGVCIGIIPTIILLLSRNTEISNATCLFFRMFFVTLILGPRAIGEIKKVPQKKTIFLHTLAPAFSLCATSILLYASYEYIPSGIGITLHYLYLLFVMLINVVFYKASIDRAVMRKMFMVLIGIVLLCDAAVIPKKGGIGIVLAVLSAISFAAFMVLSEHFRGPKLSSIAFTWVFSLYSSFILLMYRAIREGIQFKMEWSLLNGGLLLSLGLLGCGYFVLQSLAIRRIGALMTSILETTEPLVCVLGSAFVLHDAISFRSILGMTVILAVVIMLMLRKKK